MFEKFTRRDSMEKLNIAIADDNERMVRLLGDIVRSDEELQTSGQLHERRRRFSDSTLHAAFGACTGRRLRAVSRPRGFVRRTPYMPRCGASS